MDSDMSSVYERADSETYLSEKESFYSYTSGTL